MDSSNDEDAVVNRGTPIPLISVTNEDSPAPGKREAWKQSHTAAKLREKLEGLESKKSESSKNGLQDRIFTMLFQQMIPEDESVQSDVPVDRRSRSYVDRPSFSLPVMSANFRRFNARIGVAFVFQNRLIRLFTWVVPTQTLAFLAVYTFLCLDPTLLAIAPLAACLFFVMVPTFLTRHPPPPNVLPMDLYEYPLHGPPVAPPRHIKPAPELSKDFFRNMRDLQNAMEDFSRVHDTVVAWLAPSLNFSNEALSSSIFLMLFGAAGILFIAADLVPWRAVFLIGGWIGTCAGHPSFQDLVQSTKTNALVEEQETLARSSLINFANQDILMSTAPEKREVEIYELQHRNLHNQDAEWESFVFSPSPYTPLSPPRVAGDRPRGTRFFEDVQAPYGWRWADKKWGLDLYSKEWVHERCVTGVEVEIEGERWVSDIEYDDVDETPTMSPKSKRKGKTAAWEEGSGNGKLGEWRRRRWTRVVERKVVLAKQGG